MNRRGIFWLPWLAGFITGQLYLQEPFLSHPILLFILGSLIYCATYLLWRWWNDWSES